MNAKTYDFYNRALEFAKDILDLTKTLKSTLNNRVLSNQIVRSACSIGANYREACEGYSKRDSSSKMHISLKECKETDFWLELIKHCNPEKSERIGLLSKENRELSKILFTMIKNLN